MTPVLAADSPAVLDTYLHLGRILVAERNREVIGHLQLVGLGAGRVELKNVALKDMAVREARQDRGVRPAPCRSWRARPSIPTGSGTRTTPTPDIGAPTRATLEKAIG